ncbi:DUF2339 domain-containing protein [Williamsia deligens]|uniref:DUF2339 domain-containing protein n=1 Tax=Williamsia deligens TaxID=321325 RepID=A0ABW3G559_9NOCA|nr:DUF2339 domain-containing protein [Williamsia deligens]MCP2194044.1 putative membrane protein (DUF2339) [Williamsia deligens]
MTTPHPGAPGPDWTVLGRVSHDFGVLSRQMAQLATDLDAMHAAVRAPAPPPPPQPQYVAPPVPTPMAPPMAPPMSPRPPSPPQPPLPVWHPQAGPPPPPSGPRPAPRPAPPSPSWLRRAASATDGRLVGATLAVAGVGVTLVGVVLLLVLAAQAGILRPEVRVAAGAVFAVGLVALAARHRRRGGRVGAIALAATGVATAYLDVVAITRIYHWVPAAAGLTVAAVVAGAGLFLAHRWRSEHLGLTVLVPLIALAPFVTGGVDLLLVGFMLVLSAVTVPVVRDTGWMYLYVAGVAASALWTSVTVAAAVVSLGDIDGGLLTAGCGATAALCLAGTVLSVPRIGQPVVVALGSVAGCVPLIFCGVAVDRILAAAGLGALAAVLTVLVVAAPRIPGTTEVLRATWAVLAATAAVIAIPVGLGATTAVPSLIALALAVVVVGRGDRVVRAIGQVMTAVGALAFLGWSVPLHTLIEPVDVSVAQAISAAVAGGLLAVAAGACAWSVPRQAGPAPASAWPWVVAGVVALYGVTAASVTVGVAAGGTDRGFLAGHMVATILWAIAAGATLTLAGRMPAGPTRVVPIAAGMALTGAAIVKLITFDLATLDGAFRVGAFIVAGLILLAVGARYARTVTTSAS